MLKIRKPPSRWTFETSSSVGGNVSIIIAVGAGKGSITLNSPGGGPVKFQYASAGAGFGVGAKFGVAGAAEENLSGGRLYLLDSFHGAELEIKDIVGGCLIAEVSAGIIVGGSANAMLLGIDPGEMQNELNSDIGQLLIGAAAGPLALDFVEHQGWFQSSAKAVLFMAGATQGPNIGAGVLGSIGYVWLGAVKPEDMRDLNLPLHEEAITLGPRRISQKEAAPPIILDSNILFDFSRYNLKPTAEHALQKAGAAIRAYQGRRIQVQGFTDSIGGATHNQVLSLNRANAVKKWLVSRNYVRASNAEAIGYGEEHPVAFNNNPAGRAKNRRVEIHILQA